MIFFLPLFPSWLNPASYHFASIQSYGPFTFGQVNMFALYDHNLLVLSFCLFTCELLSVKYAQ